MKLALDTDKNRLLSRDETRLERRQAAIEEQARQVDVTSQQLAQQAGELKEQQKQVADRRQTMDRHLSDMRAWYRQKLRELAGTREPGPDDDVPHEVSPADVAAAESHDENTANEE